MKAREILEEARNNGFKLEFDVDINNDKPMSYKDIIYNKNELQDIVTYLNKMDK